VRVLALLLAFNPALRSMGWGTKHDNFVTHQPNVELVADRIVSHLATMLATSNALNAVLACPRPYEALMVGGGIRF